MGKLSVENPHGLRIEEFTKEEAEMLARAWNSTYPHTHLNALPSIKLNGKFEVVIEEVE